MALAAPKQPPERDWTASTTLVAYAQEQAVQKGIDAQQFVAVMLCESNGKPDSVGDHGQSFGVFQYYLPAHPEITKEEALDPKWAIEHAAQDFADGRQKQWTCFNKLFAGE